MAAVLRRGLCSGGLLRSTAALSVAKRDLTTSASASRHQGEPPLLHGAGAHNSAVDVPGGWPHAPAEWASAGHLYSLHASELLEQNCLHSMRAAEAILDDQRAAAAAEAAAERAECLQVHTRSQADEPAEPLAAGGAAGPGARSSDDEEAALAACRRDGTCPTAPDFYEAFDSERQLVIRSAWLCAGASSLSDMRRRLEERARMIADLEADGWQLEAPVDEEAPHYACLHNPRPKPHHERRVLEAWSIVELWDRVSDGEEPSAKK